jgi:phospholipid/cholesterol/gamma-HCH transport system substrate-binding protein
MLLVLILFTGINRKWFARQYVYYSRFNSAEGLTVGMSLKLRGFEIGRIKTIDLNKSNLVDVSIAVYEDYLEKIRPDSVIELVSSPIGVGGGLNFYPGLTAGEPVPEFSFIPSTQLAEGRALVRERKVDRPAGVDPINELLASAQPLIADLDATVIAIGDLARTLEYGFRGEGDDALSSAFNNVAVVSASLIGTAEHVREIAASLAALSDELEDPTGIVPRVLDPSGSLATFLNDDDELWNGITGILVELEGSMANLNTLTGSISGMSPQIGLALQELVVALKEAEKVMEGLQNNPLLKRGISPETPPSTPGADLREEDF